MCKTRVNKPLDYIDTKCKNGKVIELFNKYPR